ncbi:hypothetical protein EVG20_g7164 [Dentipellis fragilis]|uniref:Uncharacterized protein n=1 Tax=Dentipellis fragilis TaxID=205917 RepID=A0A4Y9YFM1_9AGAM|nr:hypothetical protein EVG20_g7164 [Dentipellis fragilis]
MPDFSYNQKLLIRRGSRIEAAFHAWRIAGSLQSAEWLDQFAVEHETMYEELMHVRDAGEAAVLHPIAWSLHYRRSMSEPSSDSWIVLVSAQDPDIVEMLENEEVPVPDGTEDFEEVDGAPQETRWWKFKNIVQNSAPIPDGLCPQSSSSSSDGDPQDDSNSPDARHGEIQRGSPATDSPHSLTLVSSAPTSNNLQPITSTTVDAAHSYKHQGSAVSGIKKVTLILPPRPPQDERLEMTSNATKKRKHAQSSSRCAADSTATIPVSRSEPSHFKQRRISDDARRTQDPVACSGDDVEHKPDGQRRKTSQQRPKKRRFTKAELEFMAEAAKVKLAPCQRCNDSLRECISLGIGNRCANCHQLRRGCTYVAKGNVGIHCRLKDPSNYWDVLLRNAERPLPVLPAVPYLYPLHKIDRTGINHMVLIQKLRRPITYEDAERPLGEAEIFDPALATDIPGLEVEEDSEETPMSPIQIPRDIAPYGEPTWPFTEDTARAIAAMKDLYQKETAVLQGGPGSGSAEIIQSLVTEFATSSAREFLL